MAVPRLHALYAREDAASPALVVKIIGHQWYWEYEYSTGWVDVRFDSYIAHERSSYTLFHNLDVDNRLVLPVSTDLMFLVTSVDVLHSWTVPSLGIKCDAVPGRLNYLLANSPYPGVSFGQCREVCGANHRFMPVVVEFVPYHEYLLYLRNVS